MGQIPFTRGVPSADMLPVDDLREAAAQAFASDAAGALSYAPGGYAPLREWIGERHGVDAGRVLLVNGSLQGVAFLAQQLFLGRGGRALVEDPTYDRTLISLRTFGATVEGVPLTGEGIDVDALERALDAGRRRPRVHDPDLPEPGRRHAARGRPPAAGRAGPRARRAGGRGRPLRAAAVRGRAAAHAARAGRR